MTKRTLNLSDRPSDRLAELLASTDARVSFDPERDITKPCFTCGTAQSDHRLIDLKFDQRTITRPFCEKCIKEGRPDSVTERQVDRTTIVRLLQQLKAQYEAVDRARTLGATDSAQDWEDVEDEWSADISANHPMRNDAAHEHYATAMKMVGHRHSKAELVSLVSWLLVRLDAADRTIERCEAIGILGANEQITALTADNEHLRGVIDRELTNMTNEIARMRGEVVKYIGERDNLRAEMELLREVERYAREQDGEAKMLAALVRLDALREEEGK